MRHLLSLSLLVLSAGSAHAFTQCEMKSGDSVLNTVALTTVDQNVVVEFEHEGVFYSINSGSKPGVYVLGIRLADAVNGAFTQVRSELPYADLLVLGPQNLHSVVCQ